MPVLSLHVMTPAGCHCVLFSAVLLADEAPTRVEASELAPTSLAALRAVLSLVRSTVGGGGGGGGGGECGATTLLVGSSEIGITDRADCAAQGTIF